MWKNFYSRPQDQKIPPSTSRRGLSRMKKPLIFFAVIIVFLITLYLLSFFWWKEATQAPSNVSDKQRFLITKGKSAGEIAKKLESEGFIKSELAFRIYVQFNNLSKDIPSGEYDLPKNLSLAKVVDTLLEGPSEVWVTIPEGLRREEIVEKVVAALNVSEAFVQSFREEFLEESKNLEGYLFPDTYLFPKDITASKVIARLNDTFKKKAGDATLVDIILASLIERETRGDEEKPVVAGIILKRLKADWPLQVDATLQYAVGTTKNWWPVLTKRDLVISSPYNSYNNLGLPPTPIANPGLTSIKAAQNPQDSKFWFYLHDTLGQIHYAQTLKEHNENIRKYLKK